MNLSRKIAAELAGNLAVPKRIRRRLFRHAGVRVGGGVDMRDRVRFVAKNTTLGDHCFIGVGCYFEDHAPVSIGRNVWLAAHCKVLTATHDIGPSEQRAGAWQAAPVTIGDGSWLGAGVMVLPGVTIGPGCVIAAGSVVTSDCLPNGLYAGVPATLKRMLAVS